jgi:DNA-binding NarL/FixJ family response regulator
MKILIADDHWIVRETLRQVLKQLGRRDEIVEASSFGEMLQVIDNSPDIGLILVDLVMPDFEAFDGLKALRRRVPQVPLVVISVHENREHVLQAINLGVIGYIPKTAPPQELLEALRLVMDGHVSYPRHILQQAGEQQEISRAPSQATAARLTDRESDVLLLLGEGTSVSRIAEKLELSPHTVRVHISNMMRRLDFGDRASLLHYAINRRKDA